MGKTSFNIAMQKLRPFWLSLAALLLLLSFVVAGFAGGASFAYDAGAIRELQEWRRFWVMRFRPFIQTSANG